MQPAGRPSERRAISATDAREQIERERLVDRLSERGWDEFRGVGDRIAVEVLVAELVHEHRAAVDERPAGVQVVDDARQEVQHVPRDLAASGEELAASVQQQRQLLLRLA